MAAAARPAALRRAWRRLPSRPRGAQRRSPGGARRGGGAGAGAGCAPPPRRPPPRGPRRRRAARRGARGPPARCHQHAAAPAKNNPGKRSREPRAPARDVTRGSEQRASQRRTLARGDHGLSAPGPRPGESRLGEAGQWYCPR